MKVQKMCHKYDGIQEMISNIKIVFILKIYFKFLKKKFN